MITYTNSRNIDFNLVKEFICTHATWKVPTHAKDWEKIISNSNAVITAWKNKTIIGFIRAISDTVRFALLLDVLVHPDYHGQGIGSELINRILKEKDLKVRTIIVGTPDADKFYEKFGFINTNNIGQWLVKVQEEYENDYIYPVKKN